MRRALAPLAAIIVLSAAPAGAGEPLDVELTRLGPPTREVWLAADGCLTPAGDACTPQQWADAEVMAGDARVRFGRLVTDLAMAFTSNLGQLASTTGYSGFQVDLEVSYTDVSREVIGTPGNASFPDAQYGGPRDYWQTSGTPPSGLLVPSVHVRKGLPYGFELGGRFSYLAQSSYFAGQVEGKWAFVEGFKDYPDVALRVAWTKVLGPPELDLSTTELGLLASKRFGVSAVASLTPYLALRLTRLDASTRALAYGADYPATPPATPLPPDQALLSSGAFPTVSSTLYRTTAGLRFTTFAVSMAAELTYYGGGQQGEEAPAVGEYRRYSVPASFSGAFKFGFAF
jgi:hypothetical protein